MLIGRKVGTSETREVVEELSMMIDTQQTVFSTTLRKFMNEKGVDYLAITLP